MTMLRPWSPNHRASRLIFQTWSSLRTNSTFLPGWLAPTTAKIAP